MKTAEEKAKECIDNLIDSLSLEVNYEESNYDAGQVHALSDYGKEIYKVGFLEGQSNPKIKQLEWVEYESLRGRKSYFAETPFTPYEVSDGGGYYVMFSPGKRLKFKSADEAKSFAQKDFEARIKECLIIE